MKQGMTKRRGSTMVETAIVLNILLILVFGMLDLGMAAYRKSMVSHAARELARIASVHGSMSPSPWGPTSYAGGINGSDVIAQSIQGRVSGLNLDETLMKVDWPDGNDEPESRVQVTISTKHQPMISFLFGNIPWTLTSSTTVQINH